MRWVKYIVLNNNDVGSLLVACAALKGKLFCHLPGTQDKQLGACSIIRVQQRSWRNNRFRLSHIRHNCARRVCTFCSPEAFTFHETSAASIILMLMVAWQLLLGALYGPQMNCSSASGGARVAARVFACFCFG
jgi:hypothetical protein